jgi:uncharacterized protein YndB with AHSA1/START domain
MSGIVTALLIAIAVAAAYFLIRAAQKPDRFRIARSVRIAAPAAAIYPHIASMERFKAWSPWQDKDPAMSQTLGGPSEGVGAWMEWRGNGKVGQGRMEVVEAAPPSRLAYRLDFLKPMQARNMAEFTLVESGGADGPSTMVTWAMTGESPFMSKLFDAVMNMDKLVGRDFEAGLAKLKVVAES